MSETESSNDESLQAPLSKKQKTYKQKYNKQWEKDLKWVAPVRKDPYKAYCKPCAKELIAGLSELKKTSEDQGSREKGYCCIHNKTYYRNGYF